MEDYFKQKNKVEDAEADLLLKQIAEEKKMVAQHASNNISMMEGAEIFSKMNTPEEIVHNTLIDMELARREAEFKKGLN